MPRGLDTLDWLVLAVYALLLIASSVWFGRRGARDTRQYFLGGRSMPAWVVSLSVVATSLSAASFIGVPQNSYDGNLTYLATNLGMVVAAIIVATLFIPRFYAANVQTIYELIGTRFGARAGAASSAMFQIGRAMSAGARIYIGALPASIVLFGDIAPAHIMLAIGVLGAVGIVYTLVGGVSSVIWTDAVQLVVLLGACVGAIIIMLLRIDAPLGDVWQALQTGGRDGSSKLRLIDPALRDGHFDFSTAFSLPACIIGFALLGIGSYGVDHDLVQRMLTCRDAKRGAWSAIAGIVLIIPSVALFLIVGLLLWVFYNRPDLSGEVIVPPDDSRRVFLSFIVDEMPSGLSGLMMAGLFAAGLSSLNSAINAMSSAFVNDHYKRLVRGRDESHYLFVGRLGVVGWGIVLCGFACLCVVWQTRAEANGQQTGLLVFALSVMIFAYAGLIAVFLAALLTRRGRGWSAIAALVVGFVAVLLMEPLFWGTVFDLGAVRAAVAAEGRSHPGLWMLDLAFVWKLLIATCASMAICILPPATDAPSKRRRET